MTGPRSGLVAVLFTDLVGSTELMSQLGDRAFDDLRRRHFAALSKAVAAHGGEEVKNTGDGLMAVFPAAAEAVDAAVAMQQATARQSKNRSLAIRVGVAVGDAMAEGDDYFGTPVVEAARLVAAARPGQILTTQIARALAGARCTATFTDQEPLTLKGLPDPVAVCEVGWQPAGSAVPMPALLTDIGRIFVGRDAEVERLQQLWKEATSGERRVVFVAGEPGVGKTRLAAELATRVHEEGGLVLAGRCDEDLGVPFQPFVEALRHFVDHTAPEPLAGQLGRYGGELTRLVPDLTELVPDLPPPVSSDPETERYRLFDAVAAWLATASAESPLLLVLDDLQWAAKPTILLLRHVMRVGDVMRLLVVTTYRDTDVGRGHPLADFLADARRTPGVERIALVGFDASGVAAFLQQVAGHDLDAEGEILARAVWQETEGNAFFVAEVVRHLAESGAIQRRDGRWTVTTTVEELGIPEGVRDVVGRRLSRLSQQANDVLACASVVGLEFDPAVVQAAGGFPEDVILSALDEAVGNRLVVDVAGGASRFSHALVRATLYDELTAPRRTALHRRVAQAIETVHGAVDAYLPALAYHWARASAPAADTVRAIDYATRAGDHALAQLAHDEAATYYLQALELLEVAGRQVDDHQHVELLIALGEAQRRAGDPAHRETLLEAARRAREMADHTGVVRAALANSRGALYSAAGAVDHQRIAALEEALGVVDERDASLRARILANLALELTWSDRDRRTQLSGEALSLARTHADPAALAEVLIARYYAIAAPDTLTERLADTEELLLLTGRSGDPVARSRALALRCRVAMESGDVAEADRCLQASEPLTADLGQPTARWVVAMQRVGLLLVGGGLEQAETQARSALELGESSGQPDAGFMFIGQLAAIRAEQDRLDELIERLSQYIEELPAQRVSSSLLALALAKTGHSIEARDVFETLARSDFAEIPFNALWLRAVTDCAVVCHRLHDTTRAGVIHPLLAPYADQLPVFSLGTPNASVSYFLGLLSATLSQWGEADKHFSAAHVIHHRIDAPIWLARTRVEWARMLLTRREAGDVERARELLGQALTTARQLGLGGVERQAVALLGELP